MSVANRLLVVDDARSVLLSVQAALIEASNLSVDTAASLAEVRQLVDTNAGRYAAAVVDLNLPDAPDGEAVDYVLMQGIPVIVLTGNLNAEVRSAITKRPIVDYVIKQGLNAINVVCRDIVRLQRNLGRKVLIVDDNDAFMDYLTQLLQPQGVTLLMARNGEDAMAMFVENPDIALVLIDFQIPDMDGTLLTNSLRSRFPSTALGIIGMTVSTDPFIAVRFLKAGADDLLRKPFLDEELVSRINTCLDSLDNIATIVEQANRDYLTQLYNRRYLFELGEKMFKNAERKHIRLTVAIIDIDHFKQINDTWGHQAGDAVLKVVSRELLQSLRGGDLLARIGGEEFCILAVNVDAPLRFIDLLRQRVEALEIDTGERTIRVTMSAGIAGHLGATLDATLHDADQALYVAKHGGRNRTVVSV